MKPWEETWEAQRYVVEMAGDAGRQLGQFVDDEDDPEDPSCDRDRARLAAAAPEMARLLLKLQYRAGGHAAAECISCGRDLGFHDDDCELVATLRKAGALQSSEDK